MNDMRRDFKEPTEKFGPSREELDRWGADINRLRLNSDLDSVMRELACIYDWYRRDGVDHLQQKAYRKALDWLQTLKSRLEDANRKLGAIKALEYTDGCGDSDGKLVPGTEQTKIMLYNTDVISDQHAEGVLDAGLQDLDPRVVVLWPSQAAALFPGLGRGEKDKDEEE